MNIKKHKISLALGLALLASNSHSSTAVFLIDEMETMANDEVESSEERDIQHNPGLNREHRDTRDVATHATINDYIPGNHHDDSAPLIPVSSGKSVFSDVGIFNQEDFYSRSFQIDTEGTYLAVLTDFESPHPLNNVGIHITTPTKSLGMLEAPGYFTFDADPGNYLISLFAETRNLGQYGIDISMVSSPVPLPGAVWLFGWGLLGLASITRKPGNRTIPDPA